jgi:hypothetical protein
MGRDDGNEYLIICMLMNDAVGPPKRDGSSDRPSYRSSLRLDPADGLSLLRHDLLTRPPFHIVLLSSELCIIGNITCFLTILIGD